MARIRTIKPEFWTDEKVAALPRDIRLTFLGIISAMADDEGRLRGSPRVVRGAVYPMDDDITVNEIAEHLHQIDAAQLTHSYMVRGESFVQIRNWKKHQKIDKPTPSRLPPPPFDPSTDPQPEDSTNARRGFDESSRPSGAERERSGKERSRKGAEAEGDSSNANCETPRQRFLEKFYDSATAERRIEVSRQLDQALQPEGVRVRKGHVVRANSLEHLNRVLSAVLREKPPNNPDKAIVFVLRKLEDPEKDNRGRTTTEAASDDVREDEQLIKRWGTARDRSVEIWLRGHKDEAEKIRDRVKAEASNEFALRGMLLIEYTKAAGFPEFEAWCKDKKTNSIHMPLDRAIAAGGEGVIR